MVYSGTPPVEVVAEAAVEVVAGARAAAPREAESEVAESEAASPREAVVAEAAVEVESEVEVAALQETGSLQGWVHLGEAELLPQDSAPEAEAEAEVALHRCQEAQKGRTSLYLHFDHRRYRLTPS